MIFLVYSPLTDISYFGIPTAVFVLFEMSEKEIKKDLQYLSALRKGEGVLNGGRICNFLTFNVMLGFIF